ncbi:hypothetical protein N7456_001136 [Penicillium angulare]|uniref:Zn(2)-C6 fungal-type domain-containing protein n=1 Tax=Penicillium angulare TaxID=116970 RepID=A0A9W9GDB9_9EURO|nr:hypothetical protein N7456_001136 [Penicillium angulare]
MPWPCRAVEQIHISWHMEETSKRRTRTGCLTCRRRKKKCDEARPSCTGCHRNNLECQWESHVSLSTPRRRNRYSRVAERLIPGLAWEMMNVFPILTPDIATRLLSHFLDASPRWLSTRMGPQRTDYLRWLKPAISESSLVLNCVLTVASSDLLKYYPRDMALKQAALEYYGQTLSQLRGSVVGEVKDSSSMDDSFPGTESVILFIF